MKNNRDVREALVLIFQLGINMLVPIFMCTWFGLWLTDRIGHKWLVFVLMLVGIIAGIQNCYVPIKRIIARSEKDKGSREIASEEVNKARGDDSKHVKKNQ